MTNVRYTVTDVSKLLEEGKRHYAPYRKVAEDLTWRTSRKGNPWVNIDGFNITIYQRSGDWFYRIKRLDTDDGVWSDDWSPTELDAKAKALEALENMKPKSELSRMLKEIRADQLGVPVTRVGNVIYVAVWRKSGSNKYGNTINKHD